MSGVAYFNHFHSFSISCIRQAVAWHSPGKGEEYQLFWPDTADLVRLAAKANATIVPFSGVGSDEHLGALAMNFPGAIDASRQKPRFFAGTVLDSDELLGLPVVGFLALHQVTHSNWVNQLLVMSYVSLDSRHGDVTFLPP